MLLDGSRLAAPAAGAAAADAAAPDGAPGDAETILPVMRGLSLLGLAPAAGAAACDEAAGAAADGGVGVLALRVATSAAAANLPPDEPADPRGVVGGDLVERFAAGAALSLRLAAPWTIGAKPAPR